VLPYGFDLKTDGWLAEGAVISSSLWTITRVFPDNHEGITLTELSDTFGDNATLIWLQGGVSGEIYRLTNTFESDDEEKDRRSFLLAIEDR
jgi:hypothetical protein